MSILPFPRKKKSPGLIQDRLEGEVALARNAFHAGAYWKADYLIKSVAHEIKFYKAPPWLVQDVRLLLEKVETALLTKRITVEKPARIWLLRRKKLSRSARSGRFALSALTELICRICGKWS